MLIQFLLNVMPCQLVISYGRFKNTNSSETQLTIHQSTWSNVPQDWKRRHRCHNLKSRVFQNIYLSLDTWQVHLRHFTSRNDLKEFPVLECLNRVRFW